MCMVPSLCSPPPPDVDSRLCDIIPMSTASHVSCLSQGYIIKTNCIILQVMAEIRAMEQNIEKLQEAIQQKVGPMMLAQTRLGMRSQRPNNELVRDPVQYGLVDEVGQISGSVEGLKTRLAESESALKALNRNELKLKENINIKTNSLEIDEGQCMTLRSQLDLKEIS